MNIIGVIPARMASSRFPGKPLKKLCGIPMIGHVYYRACMSKLLDGVYVATCDKEIVDYVESIGGNAVMTSDSHERASDRVAEAVKKIERKSGKKTDIVVMIQGDEPLITPSMITASVVPMLKDRSIEITNLVSRLNSRLSQEDPNEVKVVVDNKGFALYFSREPIPSWKKGAKDVPMLKQVCVIPFRRDFLLKFNSLKPTPLEKIESVDMLRVLEHGYKVKMVFIKDDTYSVDTQEDLRFAEKIMKADPFLKRYRIQSA